MKKPILITLTLCAAALTSMAAPAVEKAADDDSRFLRTVVIEEHTGTWCTWCPRGYVGMEYMREKYGDKNYIGIAIHRTSGGATDPMHCESYTAYMQKYGAGGFPNSTINRVKTVDPSKYKLEMGYKEYADLMGPCAISIKADIPMDGKVDTEVTLEMRNDTPYHSYGIAWVVTEDNVGPYTQTNGYAGSGESMGGFENLPYKASIKFNDVARRIVDWKGNKNVLPSAMEAGKLYTANRSISLAEVANVNNAYIIAMLIDTASGEIITGCRTKVTDVNENPGESGVDTAVAPQGIVVEGRNVSLADQDATAVVYKIDGSKAAELKSGQSVTLDAGMYIVNGQKLLVY